MWLSKNARYKCVTCISIPYVHKLMRGLICAHMLVWIRSHLGTVCILRCIRPHQAGPEHNCLSKFNANDHNNILSTVIRGDLSGSKQETQQLKGMKTLPSRDHLLTWHQRYRHDPIQARIYLLYRQEISHLSPSRSLHGEFVCFPLHLPLSSNSECSFYFCLSRCSLVSYKTLRSFPIQFVCVLDICLKSMVVIDWEAFCVCVSLRGLGDNIRFLNNPDNNC